MYCWVLVDNDDCLLRTFFTLSTIVATKPQTSSSTLKRHPSRRHSYHKSLGRRSHLESISQRHGLQCPWVWIRNWILLCPFRTPWNGIVGGCGLLVATIIVHSFSRKSLPNSIVISFVWDRLGVMEDSAFLPNVIQQLIFFDIRKVRREIWRRNRRGDLIHFFSLVMHQFNVQLIRGLDGLKKIDLPRLFPSRGWGMSIVILFAQMLVLFCTRTNRFTLCSCNIHEVFQCEVTYQLAFTATSHNCTSRRKKAVNVEGDLLILFMNVSTAINSVVKRFLIGVFIFIRSLTDLTEIIHGFTHGRWRHVGAKTVLDCLRPIMYFTISRATEKVGLESRFCGVLRKMRERDEVLRFHQLELVRIVHGAF